MVKHYLDAILDSKKAKLRDSNPYGPLIKRANE